MPLITIDTTAIDEIVQNALKHPSSKFFSDEALIRGHQPLNGRDHSLVLEGMRVLSEASSALEQAIAEVSTTLSTLLNTLLPGKQDQLQRTLTNCRILTAPIRRLLPELLQDVFLSLHAGNARSVRMRESLVTASISRHWREVTLATPNLWDDIRFPLEINTSEGQYERLELWLERSAARPVALTITDSRHYTSGIYYQYDVDELDMARQSGETLAGIIERFKHRFDYIMLECESPAMTFFLRKTALASFSFPILKTFKVNEAPKDSDDFEELASSFCQKCPKLQNVAWRGPDREDKKFRPPWETIRMFLGGCPDMSSLISESPVQLAYFTLRAGPICWPDAQHTLDNLTSVIIFSVTEGDVLPPPYPLPALRHFITDCSATDQGLRALLAAWGPKLRFLGLLEENAMDPSDLTHCLSLCPDLEVLRLMSRALCPEFATISAQLPRHLEFSSSAMGEPDAKGLEVLVDVVKKGRWCPGLKSVACLPHVDAGPHMDEMERARTALSEIGVSLIVGEFGFMSDDFVGPYFDREGGLFKGLYSMHGWL